LRFFANPGMIRNMDVPHGYDRVAELHIRLIDEPEPLVRAGLHLELAAIAVASGQFQLAGVHFREALHFEPGSPAARRGLESIGEREGANAPVRRGLRGLFARVLRR
jgi:hypothetical protein